MVVAHRTDLPEPGSCIRHAGYRHAEAGFKIDAESGYRDRSDPQQHQVQYDKKHRHVDRIVLLDHSIEFHPDDGVRMLPLNDGGFHRFERQ